MTRVGRATHWLRQRIGNETVLGPILAAVLLALRLAELHSAHLTMPGFGLRDPNWFGVVLVVIATVPIAVAHRWPLPALFAAGAANIALQAWHYMPPPVRNNQIQIGPPLLVVIFALYFAASRTSRAVAGRVLVGALAVATVSELVIAAGSRLPATIAMCIAVAAGWSLGAIAGSRREQAAALVAAAQRERDANAHIAVAQERARIAREMHDVVAHNVSLMVVQTMAADRIQENDPARSHELHTTVAEAGRVAIAELRHMLGLLRAEDSPPDAAPQPGLADLPALLDGFRDAGLDITVVEAGERRLLRPAADLTVYRLTQEALTNTLKHAGPTAVRIALHWDDATLAVDIANAGSKSRAANIASTGHGLIGMHERVAACAGTLHAGPAPDRGFLVSARLPLDPTCIAVST